MTHIFISYCRVDKHVTRRLAELMSQAFDVVWYDTAKLVGGDEWWAKIVEQVTMCDHFIFLLSPESVESDWCHKEFLVAQHLRKHVIPVRVRARTPIPDWLSQLHCIDMLDEVTVEGLNSLYASLIRTPTQSLMPETPQDTDLERIRFLWRLINAEYLDHLSRQIAQCSIDTDAYYSHLIIYRQLRALPEYTLENADLESSFQAFDEVLAKLMASVTSHFTVQTMIDGQLVMTTQPFGEETETLMRKLLQDVWMCHWNLVNATQQFYSATDFQESIWNSPLSTA
jgi:hypothetical protein